MPYETIRIGSLLSKFMSHGRGRRVFPVRYHAKYGFIADVRGIEWMTAVLSNGMATVSSPM